MGAPLGPSADMRSRRHARRLPRGVRALRDDFDVPATSRPRCSSRRAAAAAPSARSDHVDRTDVDFMTLDPASSTDLDQAFAVEEAGDDIVLRYAIADVGWFVRPGDPIDREAWRRGVTVYLPDGRASLHPPRIAEDAGSLLPDGPRPAVVFVVRVATTVGCVSTASSGRSSATGPSSRTRRSRRRPAGRVPGTVTADRGGRAGARRRPDRVPRAGGRPLRRRVRRCASARATTPRSRTRRCRWRRTWRSPTRCIAAGPGCSGRCRASTSAARRGFATPLGRSARLAERHGAGAFERSLPDGRPADVGIPAGDPPGERWGLLRAVRPSENAMARRGRRDLLPCDGAAAAARRPVRDRGRARGRQRSSRSPTDRGGVRGTARGDAAGTTRANRVERAAIDLAEAIVLQGREGEVFDAVVTDEDDRGVRIQVCEPATVARVVGPRSTRATTSRSS